MQRYILVECYVLMASGRGNASYISALRVGSLGAKMHRRIHIYKIAPALRLGTCMHTCKYMYMYMYSVQEAYMYMYMHNVLQNKSTTS